MKKDIYDQVTNHIIAELEKGVRPWHKPWQGDHLDGRITRPLRANGVPYRGINVVMLWSEAMTKGFGSATWMTYKQAEELGAHVRKGEKGSLVVYANSFSKTERDEASGEETERNIPFLKGYTVFNVDQIEGLPEQYQRPAAPILNPVERIAKADEFFASTGASVSHGGNRAFYVEGADRIQMPPIDLFEDAPAYYATLAHEAVHWTKHKSRLNRDLGGKRHGDSGYALEELVAELGAAFVCADLALTPAVRDEHASYIAVWLKALKDDKRAIFKAAAHAQRAADYLAGAQAVPRTAEAA